LDDSGGGKQVSAVIVGETFIVGPRTRITQDATRGVTVEYHYEGTIESIRAAASTLAAGTDYDLDETNPPKATLVIRSQGLANDQDGALLAAQFDFKSNTQQKAISEHYDFVGLSNEELDDIFEKIRDPKRNKSLVFAGKALELYKRKRRGQDYYFAVQPVFQTTQVIKNRREYAFAVGGMASIYSDAQVIKETNPYAPYPAAIVAQHASFLETQLGGTVPTGYTLGWLKQSLEIRNVAGNRSAATLEYWLDAWPTSTPAGNYPLSTVTVP
jgi:hypothetical protein